MLWCKRRPDGTAGWEIEDAAHVPPCYTKGEERSSFDAPVVELQAIYLIHPNPQAGIAPCSAHRRQASLRLDQDLPVQPQLHVGVLARGR